MEMPEILTVSGTAFGVSSVLAWAFKYWAKKVNDSLKENSEKLNELALVVAKQDGSFEKELALINREIATDKQKLHKLESSNEKIWQTISKIAQPRISDLIEKEGSK